MIPDHRYWTPTIESGISAGTHKHLSCSLIVRKRPTRDGLFWEAFSPEGVEGLRAGWRPMRPRRLPPPMPGLGTRSDLCSCPVVSLPTGGIRQLCGTNRGDSRVSRPPLGCSTWPIDAVGSGLSLHCKDVRGVLGRRVDSQHNGRRDAGRAHLLQRQCS